MQEKRHNEPIGGMAQWPSKDGARYLVRGKARVFTIRPSLARWLVLVTDGSHDGMCASRSTTEQPAISALGIRTLR